MSYDAPIYENPNASDCYEAYTRETAKPSPNLVLENPLRSQSREAKIIRGIKCKCGKAWCLKCGLKTTIQTFTSYIKDWDWRYVRQIIFTVDPSFFNIPEEAIKEITKKKKIAGLIRNLERTKGIKVLDWCWIIEWHRNGYPHWHLFVLVDLAGKNGQIGFRTILPYWEYGRITETYINSESHWNSFTGYFQKHGYFDKKKAHQSRLPDWAREKKEIIRRIGRKSRIAGNGKHKKNVDSKTNEVSSNIFDEIYDTTKLGEWFQRQGDVELGKTQGEMIDECGSQTDIYSDTDGFEKWLGRIDMPYNKFRKMDGVYIEGAGYTVTMDKIKFELFRAKYLLPLTH